LAITEWIEDAHGNMIPVIKNGKNEDYHDPFMRYVETGSFK